MKTILQKTMVLVMLLMLSVSLFAKDRYVLISHAPDSDSWWNTIKNALKHVEKDFKVKVDYRNPPTGDLADMARLIEQAAARNYKGVATTIADYDVLKSSIKKVLNKGIPVITFNSGTQKQSESLGAVMHVGQPEYFAGLKAGEKAKAAGIKTFLCVNHYAHNPVSFERCRGFAEAMGVDFKKSTIDSGDDPTTIESKVSAYLRSNPKTEAILTLGPISAHPTLRALKKMGRLGNIYFGSFDLSGEIASAIKEGNIKWGIDQQPYLQGYVPIAILAIMNNKNIDDPAKAWKALQKNRKFKSRLKKYGLVPAYDGKRHVNAGPGFVEKSNLSKVEKYAGKYR